MEYKIVESSDAAELANWVNMLIDEQWAPLGGVAIGECESTRRYFQAMTRRKEAE